MVLLGLPSAAGQIGAAALVPVACCDEGSSRAKQRSDALLLLKSRGQQQRASASAAGPTVASAMCPPRPGVRSSSATGSRLFEATLAKGKLRRRRGGSGGGGDDSDSGWEDWDDYSWWLGGGGNNNSGSGGGGSYWSSWGAYNGGSGGNDPFQLALLECAWQLLCVAGLLRSAGFLLARLQQESPSSAAALVPVAC